MVKIMNYIIINDGLYYKIAREIEVFKNHIVVELYNEKITKKIKITQLIYKLNENISDLILNIDKMKSEFDIELLFELLNENEKYSIDDLSLLYFSDKYTILQKTALLMKLAEEKILFHNFFDGNFRKSTLEEQQSKILIKNKRQIDEEYYNSLYNTFLLKFKDPSLEFNNENINILKLLHKPNKNSIEYKALNSACSEYKMSLIEFCAKSKLIESEEIFFEKLFFYDINIDYNKNYSYNLNIDNYKYNDRLDIDIFSIDDTSTTEIDDAFSVEIKDDKYIIGIHIAAPALNKSIENIVCDRISTIYYPGKKIPMLPNDIVENFTLTEGKICKVVSIYFEINHDFEIIQYYSTLDNVMIKNNLRIESLETIFNENTISSSQDYAYKKELLLLYQFALKLEEQRGKPSVNNLVVDFSFAFEDDKILIKKRVRGNPIDKLVSELMILANCTWGKMLTYAFIPAIYRAKKNNYPVKMVNQPESHSSLGVDYYTWSTSPLRRSVDYINQRQIISMINKNKQHYLSDDHILLEITEKFDEQYSKYIEYQEKMEKYWALKYLIQENLSEFDAIITHKLYAQLNDVPITIDLSNITTPKPKGSIVKVRIFNINLTLLTFEFNLLERC